MDQNPFIKRFQSVRNSKSSDINFRQNLCNLHDAARRHRCKYGLEIYKYLKLDQKSMENPNLKPNVQLVNTQFKAGIKKFPNRTLINKLTSIHTCPQYETERANRIRKFPNRTISKLHSKPISSFKSPVKWHLIGEPEIKLFKNIQQTKRLCSFTLSDRSISISYKLSQSNTADIAFRINDSSPWGQLHRAIYNCFKYLTRSGSMKKARVFCFFMSEKSTLMDKILSYIKRNISVFEIEIIFEKTWDIFSSISYQSIPKRVDFLYLGTQIDDLEFKKKIKASTQSGERILKLVVPRKSDVGFNRIIHQWQILRTLWINVDGALDKPLELSLGQENEILNKNMLKNLIITQGVPDARLSATILEKASQILPYFKSLECFNFSFVDLDANISKPQPNRDFFSLELDHSLNHSSYFPLTDCFKKNMRLESLKSFTLKGPFNTVYNYSDLDFLEKMMEMNTFSSIDIDIDTSDLKFRFDERSLHYGLKRNHNLETPLTKILRKTRTLNNSGSLIIDCNQVLLEDSLREKYLNLFYEMKNPKEFIINFANITVDLHKKLLRIPLNTQTDSNILSYFARDTALFNLHNLIIEIHESSEFKKPLEEVLRHFGESPSLSSLTINANLGHVAFSEWLGL